MALHIDLDEDPAVFPCNDIVESFQGDALAFAVDLALARQAFRFERGDAGRARIDMDPGLALAVAQGEAMGRDHGIEPVGEDIAAELVVIAAHGLEGFHCVDSRQARQQDAVETEIGADINNALNAFLRKALSGMRKLRLLEGRAGNQTVVDPVVPVEQEGGLAPASQNRARSQPGQALGQAVIQFHPRFPPSCTRKGRFEQLRGGGPGLAGDAGPGQHPGDLVAPFLLRQRCDPGRNTILLGQGLLGDEEMPPRTRCDLRGMGDGHDLCARSKTCQPLSDRIRHGAAHTGVDFVEDESRRRATIGENDLQGQHETG